MINGILNIYKEQGFTSFDVIAKLKGITKQKKIGHTGTLDPDATGVLPVCFGKATKVCDMLTNVNKIYETVMLLGTTTDTEDISGEILTNADEKTMASLDEETVREAIMSFVGEYEQIPPMYSAIKVNGKRLYELARQGIEIERKSRRVKIIKIIIKEINLPRVRFSVECSKGTYIRTLCKDIGEKIGCGACMEQLTRTQVSTFRIDDAITISEAENLFKNNELDKKIIAIDSMFSDYKKCTVKREFNVLIYNGNKFCDEHVLRPAAGDLNAEETKKSGNGEMVRVYDEEENFIGIYEHTEDIYKPVKMFFDIK